MFKKIPYFLINQNPDESSAREAPTLTLQETIPLTSVSEEKPSTSIPTLSHSKSLDSLNQNYKKKNSEETKPNSRWLSPPLTRRSFAASSGSATEPSSIDALLVDMNESQKVQIRTSPSSSFLKSMKVSETEFKFIHATAENETRDQGKPSSIPIDLNSTTSISVPPTSKPPLKAHENERDIFLVRRYFLIRLAEALFLFGSPSYRLEHLLYITSESLEVLGTFATLPNLIIMSFTSRCSKHSETILLPVSPTYDLDKLYLVNQLCHELNLKRRTIEEGTNLIDHLTSTCSRWPSLATRLAPILTSTFMCILVFHGSWVDMAAACVLAGCLQLINLSLSRMDSIVFLIEPFGAFIISFAAVAFKLTFHDSICYQTIALSGVLDQLPGLTICTSLVELTSGHIISGTARLMSGMVRALLLAFGLSIGYKIWLLWVPESTNFFQCKPEMAVANASYWLPIFVSLLPIMALSLTISLRANRAQFPIMILTSCLAFWISFLNTSLSVSADIGSVITSFMVGIVSNTYSRFTKSPAIAPILSGVILLVPGSLGVRSSLALIDSSSFGNGSTFAFQVILTAMSLSIGILASHVISPIETQLLSSSKYSAKKKNLQWMQKMFHMDELLKKQFHSTKQHPHEQQQQPHHKHHHHQMKEPEESVSSTKYSDSPCSS